MKQHGRTLTVFLVLAALQLACGLSLESAQDTQLTADDQATLVAAQVETQLAARDAEQAATASLELALAQTLTAIAGTESGLAAAIETTPTPTETPATETPTPTNTSLPPTFIPPTKAPPTKTPEPTNTSLPTQTPAPIVQSFIVYESDADVSTGLYLYTGNHVSISASGEIWAGVAFTGPNGPNGWNNTDCGQQFPLPCAHPFSLLYWVNGQYYEAGASIGFIYTGSGGPLYLQINDDTPGNGSGSFSVTITITY